ncbi:MAG: periplasmic heavy metal sensor, partial [Alphaproteobacteria bacterium]|nr:periplasmic heavy metal sensor [Alphaproteobacteria bacterium]
ADPLDRAALERAYAEQRQRNADLQATIHRAVLDAMAGLPLETRRGVVGALGIGGPRR